MMGHASPRRVIALALSFSLLVPLPVLAQAPAPGAIPPEGVWPRQIEATGAVVLIYRPQVDTWDRGTGWRRAPPSPSSPPAPHSPPSG